MGNEAKKCYMAAVKKNLRCSGRQRKAFLAELNASLTAYLSESPEADEAQLCAAFGAPESVAEDFLSTLDAKDIKKAFGWKRIVLIGVITVLLLWGIGVAVAVIDAHSNKPSRGETYLVDEYTSVLVDEELY